MKKVKKRDIKVVSGRKTFQVPMFGMAMSKPDIIEALCMSNYFAASCGKSFTTAQELEKISLSLRRGLDRERDAIDALAYTALCGKSPIESLLNGTWKVEIKSKTRYISFEYEGRTITLAGRNTGNKIEVGYSVYCDHIKDKLKNPTPKDPELSKKIASGRLEKTPIYSLTVSDEPHRFIDTALDVARTKILKGELTIKGIR